MLAVERERVVLAYHSLEDAALVESGIAAAAADQTPPGLPVPADAAAPQFRLLTEGGTTPDSRKVRRRQSTRGLRPAAARGAHQASSMTQGGTDNGH